MAGAFAALHLIENVIYFEMPLNAWPVVHAPTRAGADIFAKLNTYSELP